MTPERDDDYLDGCQVGPDRYHHTDADLPYVVLLASVLDDGREAIEARAAEWRALFGGGR